MKLPQREALRRLNFEQRVQMEQLCRRYGVALTATIRSDSKKKAQLEKERAVADFDAMPRPKRPPGK